MDVRRAPRNPAARQAGLLFGAAGALTILNNYVPGSTYLDERFLSLVGLLCLVVGVVIPRLPWHRWPSRATLVITPFAFALIAVANQRGGVSTYSYAPFFIIVFMWVGLYHRPGTSLLLAAPADYDVHLDEAVGAGLFCIGFPGTIRVNVAEVA